MRPAVLEVTSGFGIGAVLGALDLISCVTTDRVDYGDRLTARISWPPRIVVRKRSVVRLTGVDGLVREFRLTSVRRNLAERYADIEGVSPLLDLGDCGLLRYTVNGASTFAVSFSGTRSQWLTAVIIPSLLASGLTWIDTTLGPVESTSVVTRDFVAVTPLDALRALEADELELTLTAPSPGAKYRLGFVVQRGASATGLVYAAGRNVLDHDEDDRDERLVTHVIPLGAAPAGSTEPATIADHLWQVLSVASGWVVVVDPSGGPLPMAFDDLVNDAALVGPLNTASPPVARAITDTRASDGAVLLADATGLQIGDYVQVQASLAGAAIVELGRPSVAAQFGRVARPHLVSDGRGEANRLLNPRFGNGLTAWSLVNSPAIPPAVEIRRAELGLTISGQIAAARAAGTSTATPLQLKGLTGGTFVRQQDRIEVAGSLLAVTADVIPGTDGALSLPVAPGLPGAQPDNTPITLTRTTQRAVTLAGVHPTMAPLLVFADVNTDGLPTGAATYAVSRTGQPNTSRSGTAIAYRSGAGRLGSGATGTGSVIQAGGVVAVADGLNFDAALTARTNVLCWTDRVDTTAGTPAFGPVAVVGARPYGDGSFAGFALQIANTSSLLTAHPALGTVGSFVRLSAQALVGSVYVEAMEDGVIRYRDRAWLGVVETVAAAGDRTTVTCRLWVPPGFDGVRSTLGPPVTAYAVTDGGETFTQFALAYTPAAATFPNADPWTLSLTREVRALLLSGSHSAGATTINTHSNPTLARRNWQAGDTINFRRDVTATAVVTEATATPQFDEAVDDFGNPIYDGDGNPVLVYLGMSYAITLDLAASTLDDRFAAGDVPSEVFYPEGFNVGGLSPSTLWIEFNAGSLSGSTLSGFVQPGLPTPTIPPGTYALSWQITDSYTVSGAAAWGTNGRATVPITGTIPAGRSYARGRILWSNWTGVDNSSGRLRLFASASGGASAFEVLGCDLFQSIGSTNQGGLVGLWRIEANRATVPFPGENMLVAQTVAVDGSGNAAVTLVGANTNALALNAAFTITRPALLRPGIDVVTGSVVRLLSPPNNNSVPLPTTPGLRSSDVYVTPPIGQTRTVTALVQLALGAGTYALGAMPCIGIHAADGTVLGFARVADASVTVNNVAYVRLIAQATITAPQPVHLRVFGMPINAGSQWAIVLDAMLAITAATDVPFVVGSHANRLWHAGVNRLRVDARDDRAVTLTVADLRFTSGTVLPPVPVVGATVLAEDSNASQRIVELTVDHLAPLRSTIVLDSLRPLLSRLSGASGTSP